MNILLDTPKDTCAMCRMPKSHFIEITWVPMPSTTMGSGLAPGVQICCKCAYDLMDFITDRAKIAQGYVDKIIEKYNKSCTNT